MRARVGMLVLEAIVLLSACDKKDEAPASTGTGGLTSAPASAEREHPGREHEREHEGDGGHERGDRGPR